MEHKTYIEEKCEEFEKKFTIRKNGKKLLCEQNALVLLMKIDFSTSLHDLLNKINDWAEERIKPVSQYHNTSEHRYMDSENHGYNQTLSDLQTYLASLGK